MQYNNKNHKRQYTKYSRKVNDSGQRVDASHINVIQKDMQNYQTQVNDMKDSAFEERVYTLFQNNYYVNAMFMDYFETEEFIDKSISDSSDYTFETEEGIISVRQGVNGATVMSTLIQSHHGTNIALNDFLLIANQEIPVGASIKYYIETFEGETWDILPNAQKPLHLKNDILHGFRMKVVLKTNALGESPKLNGYSVMFFDSQVENNLGLVNPDLQRFP